MQARNGSINIYKKIVLSIVLVFIFLLIYSPHFNYRFPYHIDEWHHITQTKILFNEGFKQLEIGIETGFHVFLLPLYRTTNLVLVYKFLPALWGVLGALAIFWVTYKKTNKNYLIALLSVVFFASIRSDVNITGLWFFTPLTFSIPLIYLYIYLFTKGVEKENKKNILTALAIMILMIPIHAISVLFSIPFLLIHLLINHHYLEKEYKFFSIFLLIPIVGIFFYKIATRVSWNNLLNSIIDNLQFDHGWGVLEISNQFSFLYSGVGYALAIIGAILIVLNKESLKKYYIYVLWPLTSLVSIIIFQITDVSYLVPYQRNLYYFALGLPFLSAFGLFHIINILRAEISNLNNLKWLSNITVAILVIVVILSSFQSYYDKPIITDENGSFDVNLYKVINENDYKTLLFLKDKPLAVVMAEPFISTASYPISGQWPVGTILFIDGRKSVERFFDSKDCKIKKDIINNNEYSNLIKYIISPQKIDCGWDLIYNDSNYIYQIK